MNFSEKYLNLREQILQLECVLNSKKINVQFQPSPIVDKYGWNDKESK
jgi:hypothetical protein